MRFMSLVKPITAGGRAADAGVGFLNVIFAGITGLAGILVTIWCGLRGLPVLLAGTWLGLKLYGRVNEATFRKVVLVLLLLSGAALVV